MLEPYGRPDRAEIAARLGVPDDGLYMTVEEFADLPSDVHHAVWKAHAEGQICSLAVSRAINTIYRYDRAQVLAIAAGLEASRG